MDKKIMSKNSNQATNRYGKWILPILAAVLGVALLIFGSQSGEKEKQTDTAPSFPEAELSASAFAAETEKKIVSLCSQVSGAGSVRVAVSLNGGYRAVYASDVQGSEGSYRSETVLLGSGSSEEGILLGYEAPQIVGIGIVCTGGDDPSVRQSITMLVSAAFHVSTNKIYVVGG